MTRRRPAATPDAGVIWVTWHAGGAVHERSGEEALEAIPELVEPRVRLCGWMSHRRRHGRWNGSGQPSGSTN